MPAYVFRFLLFAVIAVLAVLMVLAVEAGDVDAPAPGTSIAGPADAGAASEPSRL